MEKILYSFILILLGLAFGYAIQVLNNKGRIQFVIPELRARKLMQTAALLILSPITIVTSVWISSWNHPKMIALPGIGLFALALGALAAAFFARILSLSRAQTGTYVVSGGFSNLGSLGALFVFIFLGEEGFALVAFYSLFERFFYFLFGFPFARRHSRFYSGSGNKSGSGANRYSSGASSKPEKGSAAAFFRLLIDPYVSVTFLALLSGILLNLSGLPRPEAFGRVNSILIPLSSFILLTSIGMAMRFSRMKQYIKPALIMAGIKSLLVPASAMALAFTFGMQAIAGGLPLRVILILSAMPVGFTSLVPPTIYELDVDLANTNWLISNASLVLVIPVLWIILRYLLP